MADRTRANRHAASYLRSLTRRLHGANGAPSVERSTDNLVEAIEKVRRGEGTPGEQRGAMCFADDLIDGLRRSLTTSPEQTREQVVEWLRSEEAAEEIGDRLMGAEPEHDIGDLSFEIANTLASKLEADLKGERE